MKNYNAVIQIIYNVKNLCPVYSDWWQEGCWQFMAKRISIMLK